MRLLKTTWDPSAKECPLHGSPMNRCVHLERSEADLREAISPRASEDFGVVSALPLDDLHQSRVGHRRWPGTWLRLRIRRRLRLPLIICHAYLLQRQAPSTSGPEHGQGHRGSRRGRPQLGWWSRSADRLATGRLGSRVRCLRGVVFGTGLLPTHRPTQDHGCSTPARALMPSAAMSSQAAMLVCLAAASCAVSSPSS